MNKNQNGFAHILILAAAIGLIAFLLISYSASFKDKLFSSIYPKASSKAAEIASKTEAMPDEILVKFKPGVEDKVKNNIRSAHGLQRIREISQIGVEVGKVPEKAKEKIIQALSKNPNIEYAELNYLTHPQLIPNDELFVGQWDPPIINAPIAWDTTLGSGSSIIAILDSGIATKHEDLAANIVNLGTAHEDVHGHGTIVAGSAAGVSNNGKGIAGVCGRCKILALQTIGDQGSGSSASSANGILSATDQGAKVINMSYGAYGTTTTEQDAINYAWSRGVFLVGAAGNDNLISPFYPAAASHVMAVGATVYSDVRWVSYATAGSNYGSWLDITAPGTGTLTTFKDGGYSSEGGTSLASPHVAGLTGLLLSAKPGLTNTQIENIIDTTADKIGGVTYTNGKNDEYGYGRINAGAAMAQAMGTTPPPVDTVKPTVTVTSPTQYAAVSGAVTITADASDNTAVTQVTFYLPNGDPNSLGTAIIDTTAPYSAVWDSTKTPNTTTSYSSIMAVAYDAIGNSQRSSVYVAVNNQTASDITPPVVSISSPVSGTTVSNTVTLAATASDNVGVSQVSYFDVVNGVDQFIGSSSTSPYTFSWDTTNYPNGLHTIKAKALDQSNNLGESTTINISINNITLQTPPATVAPTSSPTPYLTPTPSPIKTPKPMSTPRGNPGGGKNK
jgi:thermitase